MDNARISARLKRLAVMMELLQEDAAQIRDFASMAPVVADYPEEMGVLIDEDRLDDVPGMNQTLARNILYFAKSGTTALEKKLEGQLPPGFIDLLDLPELGTRELRSLWQDHHVTNLEMLASACQEHQLFAWQLADADQESRVLNAVQTLLQQIPEILLQPALDLARDWQEKLAAMPGVQRHELTGQIRRGNELIQAVDFLVEAAPDTFLAELWDRYQIEPATGNPLLLKTPQGVPVRFWLTRPETFARHQLVLTGGDRYMQRLTTVLEQQNLTPETLTDADNDHFPETSGADLCHRLGIQWLEPELRDVFESFPADVSLIQPEDIKGIIHAHSTWSDGRNSLEEMVQAAIDLGYQYLGISDHSQAAHYARGLKPDRVRAQWKRIDELNRTYHPFHVFRGIEADILKDGRLDYDENLLAGFDFVIASIHSHFHLSPAEQTDRLIRALRSPFTTILGHPTGRMLLARDGYHPDLEAVLAVAAEENKIVELNSTPKRLDLDWRYLRIAKQQGIRISINPDAHDIRGLISIPQGVMMARKGGLSAGDVLNTMNLTELQKFFDTRKRS